MSLTPVQSIYAHEPLDRRTIAALNPDVSVSELARDADEIGYPTRTGGRTAAGSPQTRL